MSGTSWRPRAPASVPAQSPASPSTARTARRAHHQRHHRDALHSADGITWTAGSTAAGSDQRRPNRYHAAVRHVLPDSATNDKLVAVGDGGRQLRRSGGRRQRSERLVADVRCRPDHHLAFAVDPADATHVLLGDVGGGEGIFTTADGGGVWVVVQRRPVRAEIDFAVKSTRPAIATRQPHRLRLLRRRRRRRAVDPRLSRQDVTKDPVSGARPTAPTTSASSSRSRTSSIRRSCAPARRHQHRRRCGAPFAHSAWSTLPIPDNGKAPSSASRRRHDHLRRHRPVAERRRRRRPVRLDERRHQLGGDVAQRRRRRARARLRPVEAHHDLRRRRRLQGRHAHVTNAGGLWKSTDGGAASRASRRATPALDGEAPRTIVVDPPNGSASGSSAIASTAPAAPTATSSRASTAAPTWTTITPSNGVLAFTYSAAEGLLAYSTSGANMNVYVKVPGNGSTRGAPASASTATRRCSTPAPSAPAPPPASTKRPASWLPPATWAPTTTAAETTCSPIDNVDGGRRHADERQGLRLRHRAGERRRPRGAFALARRLRLRSLFRRRARPAPPRA